MNLWPVKKKVKKIPQSYESELTPREVIDLFSRLTLHHQAALLRLMSRNVVIQSGGNIIMGYEFGFDVDGAVIRMYPQEETEQEEPVEEPSA